MHLLAQRPFDDAGPSPEVVKSSGQPVADVATIKGFEAIFNNVVAVALGFAGIVFFVMLISNGFAYMTAGGDTQKVQMARKGIGTSLAGLILVVLAYLIIALIQSFTGNTNIQTFKLIGP